jgi:ABC-2 type transport system ATP-binding protein
MTNAIAIHSLDKVYAKGWHRSPVHAVRNVSLNIPEGEAFGFIGPNGAGKSTTIKILVGLAAPSGGAAFLFGVPTTEPEARRRMGYVPENPYLYDYLTPLEILLMGLRLHRVAVADETGHCRRWLERLELGAVADAPIRSFSKGMTQRVAIAQALAIQPRLLVMDEPLSGLDPVGRQDVVDILAEYKRGGGTLFFTSHVLHDVERLADRFGLIHQGELRSVSSPAELAGEEESVMVRSQGERPVDGMSPETVGRWFGVFARSALWEKLEHIRSAGHTILEVRPTLSLELAFLKAIGKAGTDVRP